MMRFAMRVVAVTALTVGVASSAAFAQSTLETIKNRGKIVIGVKNDYRPFGYVDPAGQIAGLEIDMAKYIALRLTGSEHRLELVPVVAANRTEYLQQGRIDLVLATMTDTEQRRKVIDFSENYYASGTGLLTRKSNGIRGWDDVKGKKVCGIQGAFYNKPLAERGIEMVNFQGTPEAYKALQDGRCVGFAYDDSALAGKLLEPEWAAAYHIAGEIILVAPWGIGIRKGDEAMKKAIDRIVLEMLAAGHVRALEVKWDIKPTQAVTELATRARKTVGME